MKAFGGRRGITPLILNPGTRFRSVVKVTTWPLFSWVIAMDPIEYEAAWVQSLSGNFGEEKNFLSLPGFEPQTI